MGAMSERYRAPVYEPDDDDLWIMEMTQVMAAKRQRHTRRLEVVIEALRQSAVVDTMDDEEVFL